MNMPESSFDDYSDLFEPTATESVTPAIELELVKAIVWRLADMPDVDQHGFQALKARISELASDYLVARLVLQENYASILVNALMAVFLLNGPRQDELAGRILNLRISWFRDLLARRLADLAKKRSRTPWGTGNLETLRHRLSVAATD
jgi:hypothetical protein